MSVVDDVNILRGDAGVRSGGGALEREVDEGPPRLGTSGARPKRDGLYKYDRRKGLLGEQLVIGTTAADVWPLDKASDMLHRIHETFHVDRLMENQLKSFDDAMFLCVAINSTSVIQPTEDVYFIVGENTYKWSTVVGLLGQNVRRFFRAYADDIRAVVRWLLEEGNPNDPEIVYLQDRVQALAYARGVQRCPSLLADVSDHCTGLSRLELDLAMEARRRNVGNTANAVDFRTGAKAVRSSDNYDSTNGRGVAADQDIHQQEYIP